MGGAPHAMGEAVPGASGVPGWWGPHNFFFMW